MKFHRDLLITSTSKLSPKIHFFAIFLVPSWFWRSMGAVAQNWLILQKFHLNQNCRVSKSKIIMWHWFLVLKATKAAKRPRTLSMVLTVQTFYPNNNYKVQLFWRLQYEMELCSKMNRLWVIGDSKRVLFPGKVRFYFLTSRWSPVQSTTKDIVICSSVR